MAIQNRTTTLPGIWAENAQTTIPTPPVAGVTYRDTTLNSTAIDKAWPFKTIVDSSDFNQHAFLQDTLIKEAEQYGVMRWNNTTSYKEGGFCLGQDGKLYQAKRDNQGKEPTSTPDDWKLFESGNNKANVDLSNVDPEIVRAKVGIRKEGQNYNALDLTKGLVQQLPEDCYLFCQMVAQTNRSAFIVVDRCEANGEQRGSLFHFNRGANISEAIKMTGWSPLLKAGTYIKIVDILNPEQSSLYWVKAGEL